ncbi:hypothetical protein D3C75_1386120 [compost metagenome]
MNALVIQVSATGLPPKSRPIAGVATAPPVKLSGSTNAERQTAARISSLSLALEAWSFEVMISPKVN